MLFSIFPNHKADAFLPPEHSCSSMLDCILQYILDGFHKWDAVYFHFISLNGYIYENTLAFFPLYPLVVSILSKTGYLFSYFWSPWVHNILVGVLFSSTCHIFGTLQMYKLSKLMQMGEQIAITSAVLFAINPASVFFSTLYSEAFYSFLLLSALVYLAEGRHVIACFLLSLTTACRSNGIVNCGFACYVHLVLLMKEISDLRTQQISKCWYLMRITETIFYRIFVFIVIIGASIFPYVIFQNYAGYLYCTTEPKPSSLNFLFPSYPSQELADYAAELRVLTPYTVNATVHAEWCSGVPWTSYSLLQRQFWNVGAFRYFQLKQIPNFILAAPVLILAFNTVRLFYSRAPKAFLTLGFLAESDKTLLILPHIYHLIFLSLYGIITVHIQVRFTLLLTPYLCQF